ncbi:hypothetical protein [Streptomyces sp. MP131-18]|uniref:hypothetical protein n=1 Tax=Streptomyces sp. MP131-18 TaxID=1857892 RepID=UPI00097BA949|nr:hypothetical protein [Streptomyces sp. MP131-18]ONK09483.1 hypothetical protein STBA_01830 [Streptomyces sp. MP131-18]
MAGPSSAPRGERPGTPGAAWETQLVLGGEELLPDGVEPPRANRRARRAAKRAARRTAALPAPATEENRRA